MEYDKVRRKIAVISGTRADYGIYYSVLKRIQKSKTLKLSVIPTCMHLMRDFGLTYREIEKDGFPIYEKVNISYKEDTGAAMGISVGVAIKKFVKVFSKLEPDIIMVLGDRGEMLAGAIAADYLNIPVAHIHGGEVSGHIDGIVRHSITKLAQIHFPATRKAAGRIIRLGEERWRVVTAGAPSLDRILAGEFTSEKELNERYGLDGQNPVLVIHHPVAGAEKEGPRQIENILKTVTGKGGSVITVYPNADPGGRAIIRRINTLQKKYGFKTFKSLPHSDYLGLLRVASLLIGNSSSGIIEAPSFKLPVVNVGERQKDRERASNVIDAGASLRELSGAVNKALSPAFRTKISRCVNPYGKGTAGETIVEFLEDLTWGPDLFNKKLMY